jgi:hypothetical protein
MVTTPGSTHPLGHPVARAIASNACKAVGAIKRARFGDLRKPGGYKFQTLEPKCIRKQAHKGAHRNGKLVWR